MGPTVTHSCEALMVKIAEKRSSSAAGRPLHILHRRATDSMIPTGRSGKASRKRFGLFRKTVSRLPMERRLDAELEALDVRLSRLRETVERLRTRIRNREIREG